MKQLLWAIVVFVISAAADAGVALDMVSRDMDGKETERSQIYAQDGFLRLDSDGGPFASDVSLIFDGTRFLVMDHGEETYIIMDEAMLMEISNKMNEAMAQMEAQLATLPPEQRAMAEQMMKSQMGGMVRSQEPPAPPRVEKTGSGELNGRACTKFDVFEGDIKIQEICSAPLSQVNGAAEMMETYQGMAKFVKRLSESLPGPLGASFNDHPGMVAELIGGFPVRSVEYRMGQPVTEVTMESIKEEALNPGIFEVPEGYRLEDPFAGQ
ncbi:MAG: DUF4412 domain-containing protein [Woeseiaceae bacterium]|nr:DUF4412 domain-containing protein [Woeseiaceae bacterium]NIP20907.1 DUF4412 domain-containing protein [Woeseiaceae bacterium]NIS89674.1 DUF4412 domain-containing protein [Woeseiaceae bacterium]